MEHYDWSTILHCALLQIAFITYFLQEFSLPLQNVSRGTFSQVCFAFDFHRFHLLFGKPISLPVILPKQGGSPNKHLFGKGHRHRQGSRFMGNDSGGELSDGGPNQKAKGSGQNGLPAGNLQHRPKRKSVLLTKRPNNFHRHIVLTRF